MMSENFTVVCWFKQEDNVTPGSPVPIFEKRSHDIK